ACTAASPSAFAIRGLPPARRVGFAVPGLTAAFFATFIDLMDVCLAIAAPPTTCARKPPKHGLSNRSTMSLGSNSAVRTAGPHGRFTPNSGSEARYGPRPLGATCGLMHCSKQHRYSARGVALLGRLALTVAQNLGIVAERIHDCGRDEFDTR